LYCIDSGPAQENPLTNEGALTKLAVRPRTTTKKGIGPDGRVLVEVDPRYYRPSEVDLSQGDATKVRKKLGWEPKVDFAELVRMMVEADRK